MTRPSADLDRALVRFCARLAHDPTGTPSGALRPTPHAWIAEAADFAPGRAPTSAHERLETSAEGDALAALVADAVRPAWAARLGLRIRLDGVPSGHLETDVARGPAMTPYGLRTQLARIGRFLDAAGPDPDPTAPCLDWCLRADLPRGAALVSFSAPDTEVEEAACAALAAHLVVARDLWADAPGGLAGLLARTPISGLWRRTSFSDPGDLRLRIAGRL